MKITLTGSLGNIGKPLTTILVQAGHNVTVISSNSANVSTIEALGATAAIGSVDDVDFLTHAFTGADAIFTMVPPNFGALRYREYIASIGEKYAAAIQASGVKRVVNLSSIGAHLDGGTGPIAGLHDVEETFGQLEDVAIKHLRPGFFYVNFYANIEMIKGLGIIGSNYAANTPMVLVHPTDIAVAAAEELQSAFEGKTVRYVASDELTAGEVATALGKAIGKPDLQWIGFTDEQSFDGMVHAGLPQEIANVYVEMGNALGSGILNEDYLLNKPAKMGDINFDAFAKEFAVAYNA